MFSKSIGICAALSLVVVLTGEAFSSIKITRLRDHSNRCANHQSSGLQHQFLSNQQRIFLLYASDDDKDPPISKGNFFETVPTTSTPYRDPQKPIMWLNRQEIDNIDWAALLPIANTLTVVGRAGNDPEPRYFDDGKVVVNLSLAVSLGLAIFGIRPEKDETIWLSLEFWGRDAEYVANYVEKGMRLGVTGSFKVDEWTDKRTGQRRMKPKIHLIKDLSILETRAESELRKNKRGGGQYFDGGNRGGGRFDDFDDDDGPGPASTGGFFDT
jgi:single-strand DNA-binding protein